MKTEGQGSSAHAIQAANSPLSPADPLRIPVSVFLKVPLVACRGLTPVSNQAPRSRFPLPPPSGVRRRKEGKKKSKTRGLR